VRIKTLLARAAKLVRRKDPPALLPAGGCVVVDTVRCFPAVLAPKVNELRGPVLKDAIRHRIKLSRRPDNGDPLKAAIAVATHAPDPTAARHVLYQFAAARGVPGALRYAYRKGGPQWATALATILRGHTPEASPFQGFVVALQRHDRIVHHITQQADTPVPPTTNHKEALEPRERPEPPRNQPEPPSRFRAGERVTYNKVLQQGGFYDGNSH
jgi:hypothetical protein